jgi:hypothetical protein
MNRSFPMGLVRQSNYTLRHSVQGGAKINCLGVSFCLICHMNRYFPMRLVRQSNYTLRHSVPGGAKRTENDKHESLK